MAIQRRKFLEMVGAVGGTTALHGTMEALGLLAVPTSKAFALTGRNAGRRVVILGAGIAGLTVAYELGKLGYDCHVLEARSRPGGRCHTARRGVVETDIDGNTQTCNFDPGHYFNPGPMRIPYHHTVTLDYCRELGVPLEVFNNVNEGAFHYSENLPGEASVGGLAGRRVRIREGRADLYGYTSELLAKAINEHELDQMVTAEDHDRFLEFLKTFGRLGKDYKYHGSDTRGFAVPRGAGNRPGVLADPYALHDLVLSGLGARLGTERMLDMQMVMFQPVGGMDRIAAAFAQRLQSKIAYESVVKEIRRDGEGVRVAYADRSGHAKEIHADLCVCTVPLPVLKDIPADFSPEMSKAIGSVAYGTTGKIGLQFNRRFWEEDDQIFGGSSSTNLTIAQVVYPSYGFMGAKGVLIGSYANGPRAVELGNLAPAERIKRALAEGGKIHPQYAKHFETGFAITWHKSPYNLGGWASYNDETRKLHYPILCQPDGPIHLAGEHLSYLTGWLAGAFESARSVATSVHARLMQTNTIALQGAA